MHYFNYWIKCIDTFPWLNRIFVISTPSSITWGSLAPARFAIVGRISRVLAISWVTPTEEQQRINVWLHVYLYLNKQDQFVRKMNKNNAKLANYCWGLLKRYFKAWSEKVVSWFSEVSSPGGMRPCQKAMAGSLMPPSYVVPLPHLRGPALPPLDMRISSGLRHSWRSILTLLHH